MGNIISVAVWEKVLIHLWPEISSRNLIKILVRSKYKISADFEAEKVRASAKLIDCPSTIVDKGNSKIIY